MQDFIWYSHHIFPGLFPKYSSNEGNKETNAFWCIRWVEEFFFSSLSSFFPHILRYSTTFASDPLHVALPLPYSAGLCPHERSTTFSRNLTTKTRFEFKVESSTYIRFLSFIIVFFYGTEAFESTKEMRTRLDYYLLE